MTNHEVPHLIPILTFREDVRPSDRQAVREIVHSTGFFHDHEIDVAVELVDERLAKGEPSGYYFIFAENSGETVGYTCYGEIACTKGSFDLYWIAVSNSQRGLGVGKKLLERSEKDIARRGGRKVYIETSLKGQYASTRHFYLRCGYTEAARLKDFYAESDDKVIYEKTLTPATTS